MNKSQSYNAGIDTFQMIADLPPGLDRTVLQILAQCVGREQALNRAQLLTMVQAMPGCKTVSDRTLRLCINQLRKRGQPICSTGGSDGGYWIAHDWEELNEYMELELHSRAMDLLEQETAMRHGAEQRWGVFSKQYKLFG